MLAHEQSYYHSRSTTFNNKSSRHFSTGAPLKSPNGRMPSSDNPLDLYLTGEQGVHYMFFRKELLNYLLDVTGLSLDELRHIIFKGSFGISEKYDNSDVSLTKDHVIHWEDFELNFVAEHAFSITDLVDHIRETIDENGYKPEEVDLVICLWPRDSGGDGDDGFDDDMPSSSSKGSSFVDNNFPHMSPNSVIKRRNYSTSTMKKKSKWYKTFFLTIDNIQDEKSFLDNVKHLDPYTRFSILSRICYADNLYKMLAHQYILSDRGITKRNSDLSEYRNWILYHLAESTCNYGFETDEVIGIQFDVFTVNYTIKSPEKIFRVKDLSLDKNISVDTASKLKEVFQILPLSMDINSYGRKL